MDKGSDAVSHPYSSRIIQIYLKLFARNYPDLDIANILAYAGMKSYEVQDDGQWFSQQQVDRFYERTVQLTGNPNIAREAGRFATSIETHSIFRRYFLGFLGPARAYLMLGRTANFITKGTDFTIRRLGSSAVEVLVTPRKGIHEQPYQCENRAGIMESIALAFTHKLPKMEHPECIARGDAACRYHISWEDTLSIPLRRVRYILVSGMTILNLVLLPVLPFGKWLNLALSSFLGISGISLAAKMKENAELRETLEELRQSSEELLVQTTLVHRNSALSHEVGQAISKYTSIDDVLGQVVRIFYNLLDYDRGIIMLADQARTKLVFRSGFGYSEEHLNLLKNAEFSLTRRNSRGVFVVSFKEKRSFLVNSLQDIENELSAHSLSFARLIGTHAFICCPIVCEDESLGILAVDNVQSKQPLLTTDLNMLRGIASVIGMSIKNARLITSREEQFKSIIEVLASSIDARDNLTAGHSEKVTEYSVGISREMGLSTDFQEMIRIAALLHDYGKIGVPDSILKKQGALSTDEYAIIKTHAAKTKQILDQIAFDGIYVQVPEIAASHHERLDGGGYPNGLKGDEIPIGARIIAVADFYDAITSQRHYREPMLAEEALELLMNEADDHLDRRVIASFFHYLKKNNLIQIEPDLSERLA